MTLIAFATHRDRAEIITDTATGNMRTSHAMGRHSKVMLLPHLDAAILAQGSTGFEARWQMQALYLGRHVTDFDEFAREAPACLRQVWSEMADDADIENFTSGRTVTVTNSTVFLLGYSHNEKTFVAWGFASEDGFAPIRIDGCYAMPSPLNRRPHPIEFKRLRTHMWAYATDGGFDPDDANYVLGPLAAQPEGSTPSNSGDWMKLARDIRRTRALAVPESCLKTMVGGDVIHTVVKRGSSKNARLLTFDDAGPEFTQMVAGTLHPIGQAAPCTCGSGDRYVDCCCLEGTEACPCGSGQLFGDCCSILASELVSS